MILEAGRSLRGNVDRNTAPLFISRRARVVPYVGTWIEIQDPRYRRPGSGSRSLRGNVDRNDTRLLAPVREVASFPTWERG